jgi:hypothetical protein
MSEVQAQAVEAVEAQKIVNILKLASGEEVISEVAIEKLEGGNEIVHLVNPFAIIRQYDRETGNVGIGIVPLADLTANGSVQISTSQVVYTGQPNEQFLKHYTEKVNPPLVQVAEKKLIVPGEGA